MIAIEDIVSIPRKAARSFGELLPWFGLIAPGLVLCHNGALMAAYTFEGTDVEGKEDHEVDQKIDIFQTALRVMNDRCTIWSIRERRFDTNYEVGEYSNKVSRLIDEQWGEKCTEKRNANIRQHLFISYKIPNKSEAFFEALSTEIDEAGGKTLKALGNLLKKRLFERGAIAALRGQIADIAVEFEKILKSFDGIVIASLGFKRIEGEDLLGELFGRANLASDKGAVAVPDSLCYLNTYLAVDQVERQNTVFKFTGPARSKYVAALSTTATPQMSHASQLDRLMRLDAEFVLVQCFRFLDPFEAEKKIQDAEQFYRAEVKSVFTRVAERMFDTETDKVNTGKLHLADDAQEALVELTASELTYGYYNLTVLALGDSARQAEAAADLISSSMRATKFTVMRETQGLLSAILTSLPGNNDVTIRWKLASTGNIAELAPLRTISRGEDHHPLISRVLGKRVPPHVRFLTPMGVTYDFNTFEGDLGHTAVIGGSGAGKTSLMTLIIALFQKYMPSQTFILDKDYSLMMATVLMGGKHIDMGRGTKQRNMNPVRVMIKNDDDLRLKQWIEVLITAGGNTVSSTEGATIFSAIQALKRNAASTPHQQRLSSIYAYIAGEDQNLAAKLAPYVDRSEDEDDHGMGPYAPFFDNAEDKFELSNMIGLECGGILETPALASPFMDYVFYCIDRVLDGTTPTMIYVEEAWYMLSNPVFLQKMEDWLRTFRKKRAFVVFATQSLTELSQLPTLGSFISNIPTQIFLPAVKTSVQEQAGLYKSVFGTNDAQLDLLRHAVPKRDYLLVRPSCTRLVNTQMPELLLAINEATSNPRLRELVTKYANDGGYDWELKFIKEVLNVDV